MADERITEILDEWRAVARAAVLPSDAPKPTRRASSFAALGAALLVLVVLVAVLGQGTGKPGVPGGGAAGSGPSATALATVSAAPSPTATAVTPSPIATPSPLALANSGGTCSASQIVVGTATWSPGYGAIGTILRFVRIPLRNIGDDCVLHLPAELGVASATGQFQAIGVRDAGTTTATGDNSPKQSVTIRAGHSLSIVLGDWWYSDAPLAVSPPPCVSPIIDIARIMFPLATGSLQIELPTVFEQACSSSPSMSVGIDLRQQLPTE